MRKYLNIFGIAAMMGLGLKVWAYQEFDPKTLAMFHTWTPTSIINSTFGILLPVFIATFVFLFLQCRNEKDRDHHEELKRDCIYALLAAVAALSNFDMPGAWSSGILMMGAVFSMWLIGNLMRFGRVIPLDDGEAITLILPPITTVLAGTAVKAWLGEGKPSLAVIAGVLFFGGWILAILLSRSERKFVSATATV